MKTNIKTLAAASISSLLLASAYGQSSFDSVGFGEINGGVADLAGVDFTTSAIVYENTQSSYDAQYGVYYKDLHL